MTRYGVMVDAVDSDGKTVKEELTVSCEIRLGSEELRKQVILKEVRDKHPDWKEVKVAEVWNLPDNVSASAVA